MSNATATVITFVTEAGCLLLWSSFSYTICPYLVSINIADDPSNFGISDIFDTSCANDVIMLLTVKIKVNSKAHIFLFMSVLSKIFKLILLHKLYYYICFEISKFFGYIYEKQYFFLQILKFNVSAVKLNYFFTYIKSQSRFTFFSFFKWCKNFFLI